MKQENIGITSIGYYIPSGRLSSREMSQLSNIPEFVFDEKIGIKKKPIADQHEHPSDMGIKAARIAIEKAGIAATEINLIAYCAAGDYDYRFWSPAAKIQQQIGAKNAFAFEVKNFCNSGNLGAVDTLFGLAKLGELQKIKPGNVVVLASSAAGFSWGALTVLFTQRYNFSSI